MSLTELQLRHYGQTDKGLVRGENQDAFIENEALGLFAVADGMGGLPAGRRASLQALNSLRRFVAEGEAGDLRDAVLYAHQAVQRLGKLVSPRYGIGTTLSAVLWRAPVLQLAHVGDSVVYRVRGNEICSLTEDHVKERVKIIGRSTTYAASLTAYAGQAGPLVPQFVNIEPEAGDCFILASDGITKLIEESHIRIIAEAQSEPQAIVGGLIEMAKLRGGEDNATALALCFGNGSSTSVSNPGLH